MRRPTPPSSPTKTTRLARLRGYINQHRTASLLIFGAVAVCAGLIGLFLFSQPGSPFESMLGHRKQPLYSPLTGLQVSDEATTKQPVTAVMIENSPDARPQSGLAGAGVVYEAVAEGGITRFLALYQGDKPQLIGPVRSLRLYYLSWAAPYQASIAHVGGSGNALAEVRNGSYRDIDQFYNEASYWRSADRAAPHNVYTSGAKLDQLNQQKGFHNSQFSSFSRSDEQPADNPNASQIAINFSSPLYNTSYNYDKASNSYHRQLTGAPHKDREAGQLQPKVVVALEVATELRANNSDGYQDVVTSGNGKAYVFQNGTVTQATWQKANTKSPLQLKDNEGRDLSLVRGQTWVAAFTPGRGSISWQ